MPSRLACNPELLLADEPTTALDVTIQAQVLELMSGLKRQAEYIDAFDHPRSGRGRGSVREGGDHIRRRNCGIWGRSEHIYDRTAHPYTEGLFGSLP